MKRISNETVNFPLGYTKNIVPDSHRYTCFKSLRQWLMKKKHLDIIHSRHHDVNMRTTLTLDDDVARQIRALIRQGERSLKDVVNDTLRTGFAAAPRPARREKRFTVKPKACGFKPAIDVLKLNQLVDEEEVEQFIGKQGRKRIS